GDKECRTRRGKNGDRLSPFDSKTLEQCGATARLIVKHAKREARTGINHCFVVGKPAGGPIESVNDREWLTNHQNCSVSRRYRTFRPMRLAIRLRCISDEPAAIVAARASRKCRCMSNSML